MFLRLHGRGVLLLALLSIGGCDTPIPGTFVGESAHFRLFVDPALDPSTATFYEQSQDGLKALEIDFADKRTMLKTPDGQKIDYHLLPAADIASICGLPEFDADDGESACAVNDQHAIAAAYLPHQHELMHTYMKLLLPDHLPIPFLVEGIAQALGCHTEVGTNLVLDGVPWQQATMEEATDRAQDVYTQGGLFARYLIRTQGIDAYLRYYAQAPERRDPALFAANFSSFWNMNVDDVWSAMHIVGPGAATTDGPICPCSLPTLPTDGQLIANDDLTEPYWTMPDTFGTSIAVTAPSASIVLLEDCMGVTPDIYSTTLGVPPGASILDDGTVAIVDVPDARPRYAVAPISRASVGHYLADDCAMADPFPLQVDFLSAAATVFVITNQVTTASFSKFLQLLVPAATQVGVGSTTSVCNSCSFDDPNSCVPPMLQSTVGSVESVAAGPLNAKFVFPELPAGTALPVPASSELQFSN
jgi:hypothetical protein